MKPAERQALVDAFERRDLEALLGLMDTNVVWRGVETPDQPTPICHNRAEVRAVFESHLAAGRSGRPEIVAETGDSVVVDPHPEPPVEGMEGLHHVYTFRQGRIVTMQDYLGRDGTLDSLGLARRGAEREARRDEADARFRAVNERLDRLFAFQIPIGASLEERVRELERQVVTLRRFLLLVSLQASTSRKQALEQLDRALDQIDQIEKPEPGVT